MNKLRYFLILSLIGTFAIFSSTMSKSPILPLFAVYLMTSESEMQYIGYVIAASTIPGIFVSIVAGRLSDMYGREKLIFVSAIIFATAPFLYILATNIWILMIIRFYHGFSTAIFVPVAMAAIAETYPEQKGERISTFSSITLVGRFMAPLTGGAILYITNFYYYGVYIACGISGSLALILSFYLYRVYQQRDKMLNTTEDDNKKGIFTIKEFLDGLKSVIKHKAILATSVVQASQYFAYGVIEAYIILYADSLHYNIWLISILPTIFVLLMAIFKPIMGTASDKIGRRPVILLGLLVGSASTLLIPYIIDPFLLVAIVCSFGLGMAMVTSSTAAYVSDLSKKEEYGAAIGVLSTIMDIGQTIGPILSGYVLVLFSYWGVFTMVGLVLIIALIIFSFH